jgi:hypothetical protein
MKFITLTLLLSVQIAFGFVNYFGVKEIKVDSKSSISFQDNKIKTNKDGDNKRGFFEGLKRFLPWKTEESSQNPLPTTGMKYQLRLKEVDRGLRRHTITRIIRFFPDVSWETADSMVVESSKNGVALIRMLNSKVIF